MKKLLPAIFVLAFPAQSLAADWKSISEFSTYGLVGVALAKPLYDIRSWTDVNKSWHGIAQAGSSIGVATAVTIVGKEAFDEEATPHDKGSKFSSVYTATAFSAATHLHMRYGWELGFPAYAIAAVVGYGQVESNDYDWVDVAIGAAIGSASAWFFTESKDRKVELMPWASTKSVGLNLAFAW